MRIPLPAIFSSWFVELRAAKQRYNYRASEANLMTLNLQASGKAIARDIRCGQGHIFRVSQLRRTDPALASVLPL
jgi:hypothetical protein